MRASPPWSARAATVLTYLESVDDAQGGHTIFPTMPPADAAAPELGAMADGVEAAFGRGLRSLGCVECAQQAATPPSASEAAAVEAVHAHAEGECARALDGRARALAVRPQSGHALAWWHTFAQLDHADMAKARSVGGALQPTKVERRRREFRQPEV